MKNVQNLCRGFNGMGSSNAPAVSLDQVRLRIREDPIGAARQDRPCEKCISAPKPYNL